MQLIKSVEIRYFRSLYKVKLDKISDLNIIFGRNDSGKSNAIRALNLFFNNETNPDTLFNFTRDFSKVRLDEGATKSGAKKFLYIKIIFKTPSEYKKSLGNEFYVKRQWTIGGEASKPFQSQSEHIKEVRFLNMFLNAIHFEYIPAIKDRQLFKRLLGKLYEVLASERRFVASLANFTREVENRTMSLKDGLKENINVVSSIAPPDDLKKLFQSLDFHTGPTNEKFSLTLQRGDGIQVRHIPEILKFIADETNSKKWHIWGFEEPENSLEYASAITEATLFQNYSLSKNKQIFITSHSPAFFRLPNQNIQKFYVSKQDEVFGLSNINTFIKGSDNASELMGDMPLLEAASEAISLKEKEINELETERKKLEILVSKGSSPILFVEGETDKVILEAAWKVFYPACELPVIIKPVDGTKGLKNLSQSKRFLEQTFGNRKIFVLVDNDKDGRETIKSKGSCKSYEGKWQSTNSGAYWCLLRPTTEYNEWSKSNGLEERFKQFFIEYCFSTKIRKQAILDGAYGHDVTCNRLYINEGANLPLRFVQIVHTETSGDFRFHSHPPHHNFKDKFAKWVTSNERLTHENFAAFESIFRGLKAILEQDL